MTAHISTIYIGIKKLEAIYLPHKKSVVDISNIDAAGVMTLNAEMMLLGYVMSGTLYQYLLTMQKIEFELLYTEVIAALKAIKGADVSYQPMYPNFPLQVIEASEFDLYLNALQHYWSFGQWQPQCNVLPRTSERETINYQELGVVDETQLQTVFTQLLQSADSLSVDDQKIIEWFMVHYSDKELVYPDEVPFLETKCLVAGMGLRQGKDVSSLVKTTTDILRIVTYLSGGDIALAKNTKFKSLSRPMRRRIVSLLEPVIREEDVRRHKQKWGKLFHNLHVGDYSRKMYNIAKKVRQNEKMYSFNSVIEAAILSGDLLAATDKLMERPGEFGRRLDHLLRKAKNLKDQLIIAHKFLSIVDDIPTKNLLQLLGYLTQRDKASSKTVIFPKGKIQRAVVIHRQLQPLIPCLLHQLLEGIRGSLLMRFSQQEDLGKVWIDPELMDCPLPTQQRSASVGLLQVARGTQLPLQLNEESLQDTLRFFIYWVGQDIDLSATLHDEHCNMISHVSYQKLKSEKYQAYHSGDITSAPHGACEFIDISLSGAKQAGARYLVMNVLVFSGPTFSEHKQCYAGWMTRTKPNSGEIFDPKTVQQKIDVCSENRSTMPVVFDLKNRKAIWADISRSKKQSTTLYNNVTTHQASIEQLLEAIVTTAESKVSLYELFELHAMARGELVNNIEEADKVFSLTEGVTPYNIMDIQANYLN